MASIDFTPTGWIAKFDPRESARGIVWRPVEAWDDDGRALVVEEESGRLRPASVLIGFRGLERANRVVTAIPAAPGWTLRLWEDEKDNDSAFDVPIAAWIVDQDGELTPVGHSSDNYLAPSLSQRGQIIAP